MNMTLSGATGAITWLVLIVGVIGSLLWLYIGWRAMRAHERLAIAVERIAGSGRAPLPRVTDGPVGRTGSA